MDELQQNKGRQVNDCKILVELKQELVHDFVLNFSWQRIFSISELILTKTSDKI